MNAVPSVTDPKRAAAADVPDRVRLPMTFDPAVLAADLDTLTHVDWTPHVVRQNFRGDWSVLPLRAPVGETHPIRMAVPTPAEHWCDTALLDHAPACRAVLATLRCPLHSVRLMRLSAGSAILEHRDPDLSADDGFARLHVPIVTNPGVRFLVNGTPVPMAAGETWYVRLSDPHAVTNDGTTDRIHLVIDAVVNPWLRALLTA
ncbi:MAG: aspartyl/asparaginyl beta-hydroxylase domain-containing protein [Pseudomonadota bacterium]